jgi:sulfhydrogenase subunit gamma (sulfur reductase)
VSAAAEPRQAEVIERVHETRDLFTLRLRLTEPAARAAYRFAPGQFNMLYLPGIGGVPISIASDPDDPTTLDHTIRAVGRVTRVLAGLGHGDRLGLRGPYGRGWPLTEAEGHDLVILTGGLGCAPVVAAIDYAVARRERFGRLAILQGVKHAADLLWRPRYDAWAALPDTEVRLAADEPDRHWPDHVGLVTDLLGEVRFDPGATFALLCGPEPMMLAGARRLIALGVPDTRIWLSLERGFQCGVGHCGHCQLGPWFVCRDGPVFRFADIRWLLGTPGF